MAFSLMGIVSVLLELMRPLLLPLAAVLLLEVVTIGLLVFRRQRLRVAPAVRTALVLGVGAGLLAALALPAWTGASLGQLSGVLDHAALIAAGLGIGTAVGCLAYPPLQLVFSQNRFSRVASPKAVTGISR